MINTYIAANKKNKPHPCLLLFHSPPTHNPNSHSLSLSLCFCLAQMRTIMARSSHDTSFSFSRRHFRWALKKSGSDHNRPEDEEEEEEETTAFATGVLSTDDLPPATGAAAAAATVSALPKKRSPAGAAATVARFRSAFMAAVIARVRNNRGAGGGLGSRVTGTLFGHRRGHVHFAFQVDPKSTPVVLIELATPTSGLVREMASGLVRIALECEKKDKEKGGAVKLLEEPLWRTYCNGKKCGYAVRRECGPSDWKVLRAVEPVSMGAGVLPSSKVEEGGGGSAAEGEMMYMRARFERVVGSRDSEAFYMMNPDGNGGPELSIYLLRV